MIKTYENKCQKNSFEQQIKVSVYGCGALLINIKVASMQRYLRQAHIKENDLPYDSLSKKDKPYGNIIHSTIIPFHIVYVFLHVVWNISQCGAVHAIVVKNFHHHDMLFTVGIKSSQKFHKNSKYSRYTKGFALRCAIAISTVQWCHYTSPISETFALCSGAEYIPV